MQSLERKYKFVIYKTKKYEVLNCFNFRRNVLDISTGIDDVGSVQLHLVGCLFIGWLLIFLCLAKGVQSLGKVHVTKMPLFVTSYFFFNSPRQ